MTPVDPSKIRSEQHVEIATLLVSNVGIVMERWSRRAVAEQPSAQRVHREVLQDHLTEFLLDLGRGLAESRDADSTPYRSPAIKHGLQRWDAGWSLPEVIRDYQILRLVVFEFLEESLDRPLLHREVLAVGLAIDESISASVVVFSKEREQHLLSEERKRAQEAESTQKQLQAHAEALREMDRRKNEFLAVLAHELRNPLAPIQHAVQILNLKNSSDPEIRWAKEVIGRQSQQMARMVDDLLDISRIAHGKIKLEKQVIAIATIVQRAVEQVRLIVEARKHRLTVEVPPDPIWIEADPQRLTQVLVNLLVNAAKFTEMGGEIRLTAERRVDELIITVSDTGIGIPADVLPRVFEPFTQEKQSENRNQGGLGIGLALVRNLLILHGGRVEAFSAGRGQGSQFVVHVPTLKPARPEPRSPAQPAQSQQQFSARRVLVVDDNRDAAHSLALLLTLIGHEVQTAHDGPGTLERIQKQKPDIILLDVGMPRMDGLEVARRIRQDPRFIDIFLVALTGYGQDQDRRRSQEAGFDIHLVKPVELDELQSVFQGLTKKASTPGQE